MGDSGSWVRELSALNSPWDLDAWLDGLPEPARDDESLMLQVVRKSGLALRFAAPALRSSKALVLEAVQQDPLAIRYAHRDLRGDREVVSAAFAHGSGIKDVVDVLPRAMCNDLELMKEAVVKGYPVSLLKAQVIENAEFVTDPNILPIIAKAVSAGILEPEIPEDFGASDFGISECCHCRVRTKIIVLAQQPVALALLRHDGLLLQKLACDRERIDKIANRLAWTGEREEAMKEKYLQYNVEMAVAAVQQNHEAWDLIENVSDEIACNADFLAQAMPGLKQKWLEILEKDGARLADAPSFARKDRELVLAAVGNYSQALRAVLNYNDPGDFFGPHDRGVVLKALERERAERLEDVEREKAVFKHMFGDADGGKMWRDIMSMLQTKSAGGEACRYSELMHPHFSRLEKELTCARSYSGPLHDRLKAAHVPLRRCVKQLSATDLEEVLDFSRPPPGVEEVVRAAASLLRGAEQYGFEWDQRDKLISKLGTTPRAFCELLKQAARETMTFRKRNEEEGGWEGPVAEDVAQAWRASRESVERVRPTVEGLSVEAMEGTSKCAACLLQFAQGVVAAHDLEEQERALARVQCLWDWVERYDSLEKLYLEFSLLTYCCAGHKDEFTEDEDFRSLASDSGRQP